MFCQKCGKQIPDDAVLCPYCATVIPRVNNVSVAYSQPVYQQSVHPIQTNVVKPVVNPIRRKINSLRATSIVAFIFSIWMFTLGMTPKLYDLIEFNYFEAAFEYADISSIIFIIYCALLFIIGLLLIVFSFIDKIKAKVVNILALCLASVDLIYLIYVLVVNCFYAFNSDGADFLGYYILNVVSNSIIVLLLLPVMILSIVFLAKKKEKNIPLYFAFVALCLGHTVAYVIREVYLVCNQGYSFSSNTIFYLLGFLLLYGSFILALFVKSKRVRMNKLILEENISNKENEASLSNETEKITTDLKETPEEIYPQSGEQVLVDKE